MLFWMLQKFPKIDKVIINDINTDLVNCYQTIKGNVEDLINILSLYQEEYHAMLKLDKSTTVYYNNKRTDFNKREASKVTQSALFVFLNKTCFNGLFRVNKKNEFNFLVGGYKKPTICDEVNLRAVSEVLQKVTILNGPYTEVKSFVDETAFVYLDPPYKPISTSASFNSYSQNQFDDTEQFKLKAFCDVLSELKCKWMLSNSDVKSIDPSNEFFDDLYEGYKIERVLDSRRINSNPNKRGTLTELLITNY